MQVDRRVKKAGRFARFKMHKIFSAFYFTQETYILILGAIVGILCGYGAVIFHEAIYLIKDLFFDIPAGYFNLETFLVSEKPWYLILILILIPAIGGLLVGILNKYFEKGTKSEGIPAVIDAVASRNGFIRKGTATLKTIGSALSIGTGGAGGKEGPIVQIGASLGSAVGQYLSLSRERLKILVGCGAAAGLSAAFNAPLGGALFSMEIILRTFNAKSFSPIIIASVFGTVISRNHLGNEPAFKIPPYELISEMEFLFYLLLGILAAFTSIYFVKSFIYIDDKFDNLKKIPVILKPAIGGLFVGVIGIYLPGVYGFSQSSIDSSLYNTADFWILLLLLFAKPIATGFTIGSGGNGGTFAPSLFTGAMLGGLFGQIVNYFFPEISAPPGAYALVGMGAVVAGTTHASLTALIMIFEMTNNYKIILPLMLTIIISTVLSKAILKGSLYTIKFDREGKGIDIYGRKISILKNIRITGLVDEAKNIVYESDAFNTVVEKLRSSKYDKVVVMNDKEKISGQISFQDIRNALLDEETKHVQQFLVAEDLMIHDLIYADKNASADEVLKIMEMDDSEAIPVLDESTDSYVGMISRKDILKKYQDELFLQQNENELAF